VKLNKFVLSMNVKVSISIPIGISAIDDSNFQSMFTGKLNTMIIRSSREVLELRYKAMLPVNGVLAKGIVSTRSDIVVGGTSGDRE